MKKNEKKCKYCFISFPPALLNDHYQVCEKKPKKPIPIKPIIKPALIKPIKEQEVAPIMYDEPELDPAPYDPDSILEPG